VAFLSGQIVPHHLAVVASNALALDKDHTSAFLERAKAALQLVGGVEREKIYDPRQDYRHIAIYRRRHAYLHKLKLKNKNNPYLAAQLESVSPIWTNRAKGQSEILADMDRKMMDSPS
jgi:hypothetical protein